MYIPIAFHKNNLVLIDSMDTFALYFCSSVKQKMKSTVEDTHVAYDADGMPIPEGESEEEFGAGFSADESSFDAGDDDDAL